MKQYLLSVYQPDGPVPPPEFLEPIMRDVRAVTEEAKAAGVWVFHAGLHPASTATVVQLRDGELVTTDGPYVESKEHIGGFTIVKTPDLDAALVWARKYARAITLPPCRAVPRAKPGPMPLLPPVITATLPVKSNNPLAIASSQSGV